MTFRGEDCPKEKENPQPQNKSRLFRFPFSGYKGGVFRPRAMPSIAARHNLDLRNGFAFGTTKKPKWVITPAFLPIIGLAIFAWRFPAVAEFLKKYPSQLPANVFQKQAEFVLEEVGAFRG